MAQVFGLLLGGSMSSGQTPVLSCDKMVSWARGWGWARELARRCTATSQCELLLRVLLLPSRLQMDLNTRLML